MFLRGTPLISVDNFGFFVSDFEFNLLAGSVSQSFYTQSGDKNLTNFALDNADVFLNELQSYLSYPHGLTKLLHAAIPDISSGKCRQHFIKSFLKKVVPRNYSKLQTHPLQRRRRLWRRKFSPRYIIEHPANCCQCSRSSIFWWPRDPQIRRVFMADWRFCELVWRTFNQRSTSRGQDPRFFQPQDTSKRANVWRDGWDTPTYVRDWKIIARNRSS